MGRPARKAELVSDLVIEFAHEFLKVPEGVHVGQPFRLRSWQQEIIRSIYDQPTRRAIISFGRKNGKTALTAVLILSHLVGPTARRNSQIYSAAQSRDQASLVFNLAAKMIRLNPKLNKLIRVIDSKKELHCGLTGVTYKALSADASTAYGLSPVFIVHDELGQVKGPRSELYEALETATGAQINPLSIIISTQAPTDADLLSTLIDDAKQAHDPRVVLSLHTAPAEMDPFSEEAVRAANPAFGDFLNAEEVLAMAADAARMPSRQPEFENLILNRRVEASSPFVSRSLWQSCGDPIKPLIGVPVYGGLDLSEVADLTALVLGGKVDGKWQISPTFWLPKDGIKDRAKKDRVPYDLWHEQGWLQAAPGKSIDYEYVASYLRAIFDRLDVRKLAFDRWNFKHLKPYLLKEGFTADDVGDGDETKAKFVQFGQGFQSMSPALRDLEAELLNGRLAHGNHPVLTMCAANAVVITDPAGNRKLAKNKSSGRIDGMVALTMMMGVAPLNEESGPSVYQSRGALVL